MSEGKGGVLGYGVGRETVVAVLIGLVIIFVSNIHGNALHELVTTARDILREFGVVMVSIFGVSYWYEKSSADRQFKRFDDHLRAFVSRGASNSDRCEKLGILAIFDSRQKFEEKYGIANHIQSAGKADTIRAIGRSLVYLCDQWEPIRALIDRGVSVELCMLDWNIRTSDTPLKELSGYVQSDARKVTSKLKSELKRWVDDQAGQCKYPHQTITVKVHKLHLLDSMFHFRSKDEHRSWSAWDVNFGEGHEGRVIFVLKDDSPLSQMMLEKRYDIIWKNATPVFHYECGTVPTRELFDAHVD